MEPFNSPIGVVTAIDPVETREVILLRAARPPVAAKCFSMTSSAVCARLGTAQESSVARTAADRNIVFTSDPWDDGRCGCQKILAATDEDGPSFVPSVTTVAEAAGRETHLRTSAASSSIRRGGALSERIRRREVMR